MKNIIQSLKVILLAVVLSFGISYVFAWTAPTVAPTNGNSTAPLNTSNINQEKIGGLILDSLGIFNPASNALQVSGGGIFGGDIEVANGGGITLGGVKKTVWPSGGGVADWNTMVNKPAGFADGVDNVDGSIVKGPTLYHCPIQGFSCKNSTCKGQTTTSSTCLSPKYAWCSNIMTVNCDALGRLIK